MNAIGTDISPLAVFVSNTKIHIYNVRTVSNALQTVTKCLKLREKVNVNRTERLGRAFTDAEFSVLTHLHQAILTQPRPTCDLLLLALLRTQQQFSRAIPDGGWFRWVKKKCGAEAIVPTFVQFAENMLVDLTSRKHLQSGYGEAYQLDARQLETLKTLHPELKADCQALITSPPYPNRHDYCRIFQIELLTLGLNEKDIFTLRYNSLRSHVEARSPVKKLPAFVAPKQLRKAITSLPDETDSRIVLMLNGYFEDMNAFLHSAYRVLAPNGYLALVVGNVRHAGVMVPVDEILLVLGEALGFTPLTCWVARMRGNSAQQMGRYGREPSRESIVIMQKK